MRVSAGGQQLRAKISNVFGTGPLVIDNVHLARSSGDGGIDVSTDTALKFGGQERVTVPAGQEAWSDFADFAVQTGDTLAVSMYVAGKTQKTTYHQLGVQNSYIVAGNAVSASTITTANAPTEYYWVTALDVQRNGGKGTVVAFGDSITDGVASTLNGNDRYPNVLARRLAADPGLENMSVVNSGISGNRILNDVAGPRALDRFQRDVLAVSGVTHVIILIGINDIGFSGLVAEQNVSADQITAGLKTLVDRAKARNIKVFLSTLLPFDDAGAPYFSAAAEEKRQAVNTWIRSNAAAADSVIDLDRIIRDPSAPTRMQAAFDSGDHLHPNVAGYAAMAGAIDLNLFR